MPYRFFSLVLMLLGTAAAGAAQGDACKAVELPVGVINANGESYLGLNAGSFTGRVGKKTVEVKSMTYDDGPRRVVLVVDANKKLSADTRKAAQAMVATILAAARPQDKFALVVARGPERVVKFDQERSAISQALQMEGESRPAKPPGVMDAIMQALDLFGEPQPGDAIIVMAADLEGNRSANAKKVAKALDEHRVRMFGLALGLVSTRNLATGALTTTTRGLATTTAITGDAIYETGDQNFYPLTRNSGGLVMAVMNYDPQRDTSLKDPGVEQRVKQKAQVVYNMVTAYYRAQIGVPKLSHSEDWDLDVTDAVRKAAPQMFLLYPHELGPC